MKDLTQGVAPAQIIRCVSGDLSFGIDKAHVLSIQRTERVVFRGNQAYAEAQTTHDNLEDPDQVLGWLSDGVRQIPIIRLGLRGEEAVAFTETRTPSLTEAARVVLFAPITADPDSTGQVSSPPWGLLVDRVIGTIEAPRTRFHHAPWMLQDTSNRYFHSVVRLDDQVLMLLDPRRANPYSDVQIAAKKMIEMEARGNNKVPHASAAGKQNGPPKAEPAARGLVVFTLWDQPGERRVSMGLSISQVPEILDEARVITAPAGPDYVTGLIFWRELPVPIIDIRASMGFQPVEGSSPSLERRFIITRHRNPSSGETDHAQTVYAAIEVRSAVKILRLPIESRPSSRALPFNPGMILGQVELEDETLVIPDLKAVVSQVVS